MRTELDSLKLPGLTLVGVSRAGIETCLMVPEVGVMFDVGLCPPGSLKYETILVSHGHADHLAGLPYLVSQRRLMGLKAPRVHLPVEVVAPLRQIFALWSQIEAVQLEVELHGHEPGQGVELGGRHRARPLRTTHRVSSLAWLIERIDQKLKSEYRALSGEAIAELRRSGQAITESQVTPLLCVTGDTTIDAFDREPALRSCRVLVHEVTSWDERRDTATTRSWGHTHVNEIIARAEQFEGEALVLVHRSLRHTREQALRVVQTQFPASIRQKIHVFGC
jgi:ribonuclease Z